MAVCADWDCGLSCDFDDYYECVCTACRDCEYDVMMVDLSAGVAMSDISVESLLKMCLNRVNYE